MWCVEVRIFPSIVLYFCSKVFTFVKTFKSFTFVPNIIVFLATCSTFFFIIGSVCCCIPLYLKFNLSFSSATVFLVFTPVVKCGRVSTIPVFSATIGSGILRLMHSSSSDHFSRSCIFSAGIGWSVRFFRSKQACLAFSQFRLPGELLFVMFESGVLAFLPICASKGVVLITPCGVILNVLIISETLDAILNGVSFSQFSWRQVVFLLFVSIVRRHQWIYGRLPAQTIILCCLIYRVVEIFQRETFVLDRTLAGEVPHCLKCIVA